MFETAIFGSYEAEPAMIFSLGTVLYRMVTGHIYYKVPITDDGWSKDKKGKSSIWGASKCHCFPASCLDSYGR